MIVADRVSRLASGINPGSVVRGQLVMVVADRVSCLVSGINPGPVCFRSDLYRFWKKQEKLLTEYC